MLLTAETAWGDDALPGDDQIGEVLLAGTEAMATFVPNEGVLKTRRAVMWTGLPTQLAFTP
jgi:hypothetical protein